MSYILITGDEACQGSDAWLNFREGKIGASDAPSIMGINPWETKLECWERFVFGKKKEKTAAMQRGNDLEQKARDLFCRMFDDKYEPVVAQSKENPNLICSLDGWNGTSVLEVKCPNRKTHLSAKMGEIPDYYLCQMQHQMMVMGCDTGWYCSYDGEKIAVIPVLKDEKFIKDLIAQETAFLRSIVDLLPPPPSDKDWKDETDPERIVKAFRLKELILLNEQIETEREDLRQELINGCTHPRMNLGSLKIQKVLSKGRVDYTKLIEAYDIQNVDDYRKKPTEIWRLI